MTPKLYDEVRRQWGHLMARHGLGGVVKATLRKIECRKKRTKLKALAHEDSETPRTR